MINGNVIKKTILIGTAYVLCVHNLFAGDSISKSEIIQQYLKLKKISKFSLEKNIFLKARVKDFLRDSYDRLEVSFENWEESGWGKPGGDAIILREIRRHENVMSEIQSNWRHQSNLRN